VKVIKYICIFCLILTMALVGFYGINKSKYDLYAAPTTAETKVIQQKLKNWGYYFGSVDGIYGSKTKAAVVSFQKKNGLVADGVVGTKTAAAIGITLSASGSSSTTTNSNLYLLARCIYAEARGEPYSGMVAVGAVVLNRVASPDFPNTISSVIYQPWAFTSVNDGQINLTPSQTAINAAQDAMNGWDPTYGCLFFYNPKTAQSQWIYSRKVVTTIGNHRFAL